MTDTADIQSRNLRILHMSRAGLSCQELGRQFKVTDKRIAQIVRSLTAKEELERKIIHLGEKMSRADDLEREWPLPEVLDALRLMTATRKALLGHLGAQEGDKISLRRLMDVVSAEVIWPWSGELHSTLLTVRYIGAKGYRSIIDGIGNLHLGPSCRREWERRLDTLRR